MADSLKKKTERGEEKHRFLEYVIAGELCERKFNDRDMTTTLWIDYSDFVKAIVSLGFDKDEVEEKIAELEHRNSEMAVVCAHHGIGCIDLIDAGI